ncbi:MAG: hypothetical protein UU31_C0001G0036 [Candidatus Uhrbacteria bacterium GW2011_GWA2_41_10]|nr:MAG: hypothetical protein UU31_C0001G0036 [Candidatus Uhrbacteria bacterium GW2011_GWA2_41_10]HBO99853.1 hypothetical protein [Candidatus Uhrbacteria bacterium]
MEGRRSCLGIVCDTIADWLFPCFCLQCKQEGNTMCEICKESYTPKRTGDTCPFCRKKSLGSLTCESCRTLVALDRCLSLGWYHDSVLREAIRAAKYTDDPAPWKLFPEWMRKMSIENIFFGDTWVVSFVPLHVSRRRERGFDQAERIAHLVGEATKFPVVDLLERAEWTDPQAQRDARERQVGDMDGIFQVIKHPIPSRVILCDDVLTSGATMDAAAQILKQAGAEQVCGFVLARRGGE